MKKTIFVGMITASALLTCSFSARGSDADVADADLILPGAAAITSPGPQPVQWASLFRQSFFFMAIEHGFRVATDPQTRDYLGGPFFKNYFDSVANLHGWADGDPFIVNYVGHPMQGAVSGDIWVHNDPRYRTAEIGRNRRYWVGRLRAMAFAWAYSEEFEIGPVSEASVGSVQARFPQQGYVDHVITPVVGAGWMIAEDAVDHYIIRRVEERSGNRIIRYAARGFLNPARTFANCVELEKPWRRERAAGAYIAAVKAPAPASGEAEPAIRPAAPPLASIRTAFEFTLTSNAMALGLGRENALCVGGGGSGTFNLSRSWGVEGDVSGCRMLGLAANLSGDVTTFAIGPRYTYRGVNHWAPWAHALIGGEKITQELMNPALKAQADANAAPNTSAYILHGRYTEDYGTTGLMADFGAGVDWILNPAVAFRVGNVDFLHTWTNESRVHGNDARFTVGVVVRIGAKAAGEPGM